MLPFLELPMVISNNEGQEKEVSVRIQPSEIAYYYPGFHWGIVVVMKSGSSYLLNLPVEQFDATLATYHSSVKSNAGKFGNLKITPKKQILHATD